MVVWSSFPLPIPHILYLSYSIHLMAKKPQYSCDSCDEKFATPTTLSTHVYDRHQPVYYQSEADGRVRIERDDQGRLPCPIHQCPSMLASKRTLRVHLQKLHQIEQPFFPPSPALSPAPQPLPDPPVLSLSPAHALAQPQAPEQGMISINPTNGTAILMHCVFLAPVSPQAPSPVSASSQQEQDTPPVVFRSDQPEDG